jgi:hypothetical protein
MPMRVRVNGVEAEVVQPYGKFNYGDIVKVIKFKISKFDFAKSKVCVADSEGCYWLGISDVKLMTSKEWSV